jgi:hypothetical protein
MFIFSFSNRIGSCLDLAYALVRAVRLYASTCVIVATLERKKSDWDYLPPPQITLGVQETAVKQEFRCKKRKTPSHHP